MDRDLKHDGAPNRLVWFVTHERHAHHRASTRPGTPVRMDENGILLRWNRLHTEVGTTEGCDVHDDAATDDRFRELRRTGDRAVRDALVEQHLGLARSLAARYAGRGAPRDDLDQVAAVGLVKAVHRFDPDRGTAFSTYAVPVILGELRHHFRDHGWAVRVPRRLQELRTQVDVAAEVLAQRLGREPCVTEVAEHLDVDRDMVVLALDALRSCYAPDPLETPAVEADTTDPCDATIERLDVARLLADLPADDRRVLALRYWRGHTQQEIADQLGCSQMQVSRLLRRSLDQLRERPVEIA